MTTITRPDGLSVDTAIATIKYICSKYDVELRRDGSHLVSVGPVPDRVTGPLWECLQGVHGFGVGLTTDVPDDEYSLKYTITIDPFACACPTDRDPSEERAQLVDVLARRAREGHDDPEYGRRDEESEERFCWQQTLAFLRRRAATSAPTEAGAECERWPEAE